MQSCKLALAIALAAILAATGLTPQRAPAVTLIPGSFEPGHQPDGNTVIFDAPEGLVVLDTGRHPAHSQKILDHARSAKRPIVAVLNSHWHLDHVSGNPRLRAAYPGLEVYASGAVDGAMHGFLADSKKQAADFLADPQVPEDAKAEVRADIATIDSGKAIYPDVRIDAAGERVLAGRKLHIGFERAATQGDLWIYDEASKTLAAGDLVTLPVPFLDTACPQRWSQALAHLETEPFETLVPGHGAEMDRAAFAVYRQAFDHLLACAASGDATSNCREGWKRDASTLMSDADRSRVDGMLDYYVELLRNQDKRAQLCGA
jgi:glyoxylase-like metal-dependent hydrolase (beta-lactamase superfamily II)